MPADAHPEILITSVDGELPNWFSKKKILEGYNWSAYLKPLVDGSLCVALVYAEHTKGVLLIDTGPLDKRLSHCEDSVLPSWFEWNLLGRIVGENYEQCFPLVVLYDSEFDGDLPNELKLRDLRSYLCLSRNREHWTSDNDLSDGINHVWNDWLKKGKPVRALFTEERTAVRETPRQIEEEIQVVMSHNDFDITCWTGILQNVGSPHNNIFRPILCDKYWSRNVHEAKNVISAGKGVVLVLCPEVMESEIWGHIMPILRQKIESGDGSKIRWFMTRKTEIPEELFNCDILYPPTVRSQDRSSDGMRNHALMQFKLKTQQLNKAFEAIGDSLYKKCCMKISIKE